MNPCDSQRGKFSHFLLLQCFRRLPTHSLTHSMMKQNKSELKVSLKQRHCAPQLEYHAPVLYGMVLEVVVKSKKTFVAATNIKLEENLLDKETWFPLGNCAV